MTLLHGIEHLKDRIFGTEASVATGPRHRWATVAETVPLRVLVDGTDTPLAGSPASTVQGLTVGDRVRVEFQDGRATVTSVVGGRGGSAKFSLRDARISYGATLGIEDRFVMQGAIVSEADNNQWYTSRNTTGTESGRETSIVTKVGASGSGMQTMTFVDAGHGDAVFVEVDGSGEAFVWTYFVDWRYPTTDPARRYNYVRVPWSPGTYSFEQVEQYRVPSISGINWRGTFDEFNGVVAFRRGGGATRIMEAYRLEDILAGTTLPAPIASATVPMETNYGSVQDHAYMHESRQWFFLFGASTGPKAIVAYHASGVRAYVKEIHQAVNVDQFGKPYAFCEPEGLKVHHSPSGDVSLLFGIATGPVYARKSHIYSVDMGLKSAAFDLLAGSLPPDQSPWIRSSVSQVATLSAGVSESSTFQFAVSIAGGKVRFRGRVTGSFSGSSASAQLMVLSESFRPASTRQALCVLQGSGRVARLEISTGGPVTVYFPAGSSDTYTWVDFDISEYWLDTI